MITSCKLYRLWLIVVLLSFTLPMHATYQPDFDAHNWQLVSLPNGMEYLPSEASGCINYQGMHDKALSRNKRQDESYLLAEGLIDGKVVATHKVMPARRPSKLLLWPDDEQVRFDPTRHHPHQSICQPGGKAYTDSCRTGNSGNSRTAYTDSRPCRTATVE